MFLVEAGCHLVWLPVLQNKLVDLVEKVLRITPVIIAKYAIICHWNATGAFAVTSSSIAALSTPQHDDPWHTATCLHFQFEQV